MAFPFSLVLLMYFFSGYKSKNKEFFHYDIDIFYLSKSTGSTELSKITKLVLESCIVEHEMAKKKFNAQCWVFLQYDEVPYYYILCGYSAM